MAWSCEFREGKILPRNEFPKDPLGPELYIIQFGRGEGEWKGDYSGVERMALTLNDLGYTVRSFFR